MNEFAPNFRAVDVKKLKGKDWEYYVAGQTSNSCRSIIENAGLLGSPLPQLQAPNLRKIPEGRILLGFYEQEKEISYASDVKTINVQQTRKVAYYHQLATEIKTKREFKTIHRLQAVLNEHPLGPENMVANDIVHIGIATLYLMICDADRFLVGLKDGVHWKKIKIPEAPEATMTTGLFTTAAHYLRHLSIISRRELEVVPEMIIHPGNIKEVKIPDPADTLEDILEDAYFRQRYIVDPEGSEVRLRRAGDITRMILLQSGDNLLARVFTLYGDEFVTINLNDASYNGRDKIYPLAPKVYGDRWTRVIADTYRDLVTAQELRSQNRGLEKPPGPAILDRESGLVDQPQVIYIPRTMRVPYPKREDDSMRTPYEGPHRVKPHHVGGHRRKANITNEHREELYKFEKKQGLKRGTIVDNLPRGYTFVRPHFSPTGSGDYVQYFPIYIKRRIETEIVKQLQNPRLVDS